jgi:hypothetical protein
MQVVKDFVDDGLRLLFAIDDDGWFVRRWFLQRVELTL